MKKLAVIRKSYEKDQLMEHNVSADPFTQFGKWFDQNLKSGNEEPTAMTLSTVNSAGQPSARIVLLKQYDHENGFLFFTNYESRKAKELKSNSKASLLFFWPALERQIRIEGKVKKVNKLLSQKYFHSRPRESQIGAWASEQSASLPNREVLEKTVADLTDYFKDHKKIPLPEFWGGYALIPEYYEFWQGRKNRLHDRIEYKKSRGKWKTGRLSP